MYERSSRSQGGQAVHPSSPPGLDGLESKVRVRTALTVVDNVARTGRLVARADVDDRFFEVGQALLRDR
ncbi:hypothetical protein [Streptomyces sp. NPDC058385]|uniref:hypothetical protein n=1 Tax=Streptomyces sp. NPDC058385 TaxID=3346473 RepID=UPI00364DEB8D